jgi:excisionase family DNA binding protein
MTPEEFRRAEERVCARPEYSWLCSSKQEWFNISDIAGYAQLSRDTVRKMVENGEFPGAIRYTEGTGWRVPRSGLIEYYARKLGFQAGQQAG